MVTRELEAPALPKRSTGQEQDFRTAGLTAILVTEPRTAGTLGSLPLGSFTSGLLAAGSVNKNHQATLGKTQAWLITWQIPPPVLTWAWAGHSSQAEFADSQSWKSEAPVGAPGPL